jgi:poly-beta-1,6-N-acetyl-D-glucosamine synthase
MKSRSKNDWNLRILDSYEPKVTIIIASYNEANVIENKLKNISEISYPPDKLDLIVVDSASTDGTARIAQEYLDHNTFPFKAVVLEEKVRKGKAKALNNALQNSSGNIIATSDADCTWTTQSFLNALKFLSDKSVGAVCGQEQLQTPNQSSANRTESEYRNVFNYIRIGESKVQSTIVFEGALALYRKSYIEKFDEDCDDSGTALNLVQNGYRTIMVPDAFFLNPPFIKWKMKAAKKTRRSQHLIDLWCKCLKLLITRKLKLSPSISIPNIFLYLLNPLFFITALVTLAWYTLNIPVILAAIPVILLIPKSRDYLVVYFSNYLFLLYGMLLQALNRKQIVWNK